MNALITIDVATLTPATVFAPGGMEGIISKLEAEVRAIDRDISTPEGREAVKSLAYKVARSKTALDDMGKELVSGIKKQAGAIDADRKLARDRLDALKDEVRGPLTAWEDAEANRISGHEAALVEIMRPPAAQWTAADILEVIGRVGELSERDWQEFQERATDAISEAVTRLETALGAAVQRERDAAELEVLRKEKAEREEQDAKARAEKEAAEEAAAAAERERIRASQAEEEKAAAVARAIEQERERAAREKAQAIEAERRRQEEMREREIAARNIAEAAERKRQENKRHRAKIELAVFDALCAVEGITDLSGNLLLAALIAGRIPHVKIEY